MFVVVCILVLEREQVVTAASWGVGGRELLTTQEPTTVVTRLLGGCNTLVIT